MHPPKNLDELFKFYFDFVKLLYSEIQTENTMPAEVLFEINAAFDHLSRLWIYKESEPYVVEKVYSHLKRSCLDIFKLKTRKAIDLYNELQKIDTSIINNGKFDKKLIQLIHEIRTGAKKARRFEGSRSKDDEEYIKAFDLWEPVYRKAIELEEDYYNNPNIEWARKKSRQISLKYFIVSIIASFIAGIATSLLFPQILAAFRFLINLF